MISLSKNEKETQKIAGELAVKIMKGPTSPPPTHKATEGQGKLRRASVIILEGELGAGKTTFVKGFAKVLGIKAKIKSPTFNLMKKYEIFSSGKTQNTPNQSHGTRAEHDAGQGKHGTGQAKHKSQIKHRTQSTKHKFLIHLDCYRVRDHRDLATLDLKSLFTSLDNIVLIEWPERVSKILPKKLIRVHIDHISEHERKIKIERN